MVSGILGAFGIQLYHMTIWHDVQELAAVRALPAPSSRIYQHCHQVKAPPRIYNQPMHPLARLQKLLLHLSDNWSAYRLFLEQDDVPVTNNATERMIGSWRVRSRSVCGFKTWSSLANFFTLFNAHIF